MTAGHRRKNPIPHILAACALAALAISGRAHPAAAEPLHGLAMHGTPRHPPGFTHFPYVNPDAAKGGRLTLGVLGTFDSLNPFIFRGVTPSGLRDYVYQSLMARSGDEPFSLYGLIAESVEMPADRGSITFHLRPEARFSDGKPITPADVLFSHRVLKEKGWPYHRSHYSKVSRAEQTGPHSVRFTFETSGDREIALIMGLLPVLPSHRMSLETFDRTTLEPPVGSGPYRIEQVNAGRSITYRRNPDWWARDLPVMRGRFNFDEIRVEQFRDSASLFEAFKAGEIDVRTEEDPARWFGAYGFPAMKEGRVVKREFETGLPAGMTALVLNSRRPVFADARVRRAFLLMFDGAWINRSLFDGGFRRTQSFFERSLLSSHGRPADERERELLAPFADHLEPSVMDGTSSVPGTEWTGGSNRENLQAAFLLLQQAGYGMRDGRLVRDGVQLSFEMLAQTRAQERLMLTYAATLQRMGIATSIRQVDTAQYWSRLKTYDFDMIQWTWGSSLSPGNEQINRWSSRAADIEGSLNYAGVRNPAADAMIEKLLEAQSSEEFTAAVRAFDRVLMSGDYVIPLFHLPKVWVAHWNHLGFPPVSPLSGFDLDTWWQLQPR